MLKDKSGTIKVQNYDLADPGSFTMTKTCVDVCAQFDIGPEDQSFSGNCLEIGDTSPGFKSPKILEDGGSFRKWQLSNSGSSTAN